MKCSCGYEFGFNADTQLMVQGESGDFFHSTFADLERRAGMSKTEKARMYGCPACGRVFIDLTNK